MDNEKVIEIELASKSSKLYIFFGGIKAGIAMPTFEFYSSSKIINENKIFIRDFDQCWYQKGLPGIGNDIFSIFNYLKATINAMEPQKVYFVGNSMGGYAAILFSILVGSGEAIAFSPQTFLTDKLRKQYDDNRWSQHIKRIYELPNIIEEYLDIRKLMSMKNNQNKISIFVATDNRKDEIHANHLCDFPHVNVYKFKEGGHNVVKFLRDQGKLSTILSGNYS